jgi:hypothetical protein
LTKQKAHTGISRNKPNRLRACSAGLFSAYFGFLCSIFLSQQISRTHQQKKKTKHLDATYLATGMSMPLFVMGNNQFL